jgi:hypothetical protein
MYAALAPGNDFDSALAVSTPAPSQQNSKPKFFKRTIQYRILNTDVETILSFDSVQFILLKI